ncbi:hypothetical protein JCM1841_003366, partial [Sporobolomyces salmonicolor]
GLFGAVLRISLPPPARVPQDGPPNVKAYWVDFDHPTRAAAQEAVAVLAVRDGVVEQIQSEVPPRSRLGPFEGGGAGGGWGGAGAAGAEGRFHLRPPQPHGGIAASPYLSQQSAFAAAAAASGGGVHKRAAEVQPSSQHPQKKKKQKKDAPGGGPPSVSSFSGAGAGEGTGAGAGQGKKQRTSSVSALHFACRDRLGGDPRFRPSYEVREEGARFGATLTVPLSTTSAESRIVVVPAVHSSKREAREAVARKAIEEEHVVELLPPQVEGVQAVGGAVGASASGPASVEKTQVVALQQQEAVQPSGPESIAAKKTSSSSVLVRQGGKTSAKVRLEEYCAVSSRPAPVFTRESSSSGAAAGRVWVVIADLKFELPNPPATPGEGEEKLAGRVLRHLMSKDKGRMKDES